MHFTTTMLCGSTRANNAHNALQCHVFPTAVFICNKHDPHSSPVHLQCNARLVSRQSQRHGGPIVCKPHCSAPKCLPCKLHVQTCCASKADEISCCTSACQQVRVLDKAVVKDLCRFHTKPKQPPACLPCTFTIDAQRGQELVDTPV